MNRSVLSWLEERGDDMVALLRTLVEHESPSDNKEALDALGRKVAEELARSGARARCVEVATSGNHILAEVPGKDNEIQLLVLGHLDTVWDVGTLDEMPFRVEGDRAYGPGAFDMKAGLVQVVFALRALAELGRTPSVKTVLLLTSDEEVGSGSSRDLIESEARRSRSVLVLEPSLSPDGRVKTFRKGVGAFRLHVTGKAAHAGLDPEGGLSAIEEMARQIQFLHGLSERARGITVNVGIVRGGTRVNVVAPEAEAEIDLRISTLEDGREMERKILGLQPILPGALLRVTGGIDRPPLERTAAVVSLYQTARQIAHRIGFDLGEGPAGGGSDGNLTAGLGIPTLDGLGAVGDGAHAAHEHVRVSEMPRRAALLAGLLEEL